MERWCLCFDQGQSGHSGLEAGSELTLDADGLWILPLVCLAGPGHGKGLRDENLLCEGSEHESGGHTGRKAGKRGPDSNSHHPLCFLPSKLSSRSWAGVGSRAWSTPGQRQEPNLPPCLCRVLAGDRGKMSESQGGG